MKILLVTLASLIAASALPADRWPNVGPVKHQVVVITPTSEYTPHEYTHDIAPKKDAIYHATYEAVSEPYPSTPQYHASTHYPPPADKKHEKHHYDEKLLRKYYNHYLDKNAAFKKNLIQKAVDKTVDVTAKLTQYTVDFITRVAIETAAKLAKNGAKTVIHKKEEKYAPAHHYH